jgi:hypothetical protein
LQWHASCAHDVQYTTKSRMHILYSRGPSDCSLLVCDKMYSQPAALHQPVTLKNPLSSAHLFIYYTVLSPADVCAAFSVARV